MTIYGKVAAVLLGITTIIAINWPIAKAVYEQVHEWLFCVMC